MPTRSDTYNSKWQKWKGLSKNSCTNWPLNPFPLVTPMVSITSLGWKTSVTLISFSKWSRAHLICNNRRINLTQLTTLYNYCTLSAIVPPLTCISIMWVFFCLKLLILLNWQRQVHIVITPPNTTLNSFTWVWQMTLMDVQYFFIFSKSWSMAAMPAGFSQRFDALLNARFLLLYLYVSSVGLIQWNSSANVRGVPKIRNTQLQNH